MLFRSASRLLALFDTFMEKSRSDLLQTADLRDKSARLYLKLEQAIADAAASASATAATQVTTLDETLDLNLHLECPTPTV